MAETANGCLVLHRAGTIAERQKPRAEELEKTFHAFLQSASGELFSLDEDLSWKSPCGKCELPEKFLRGRSLDREIIAETASLAARVAKPLDNTDFDMSWRKKVTAQFVSYALQELRGDVLQTEGERWTRHSLPF